MSRDTIINGAIAGLVAGVVFGVMMAMMGTLPMIGRIIGVESAPAGMIVHLMISALIGASYSLLCGRYVKGTGRYVACGILYGSFWWFLGPLTLMPLLTGVALGLTWNLDAAVSMLPSLLGHIVYGGILGIAYAKLDGTGPRMLAAHS